MLQNHLQDEEKEILEKSANVFFEKGGRRGIVGEIRSYNGREYQKTSIGWRVRAQGHHSISSEHHTPTTRNSTEHSHNHIIPENNESQPSKATVYSDDNKSTSKAEGSNKSNAIAKLASSVINGSSKSLIVYGQGSGNEKNNIISQELKNKKLYSSSEGNYDYVKLHSSNSKDLYQAAYHHNGKLLLFSNADAALKNEETAKLISSIVGHKQLSLEGQTEDKDDKIPPSFKFTGKLIITSSLSGSEIPAAIRAHSLSIDASHREKN